MDTNRFVFIALFAQSYLILDSLIALSCIFLIRDLLHAVYTGFFFDRT